MTSSLRHGPQLWRKSYHECLESDRFLEWSLQYFDIKRDSLFLPLIDSVGDLVRLLAFIPDLHLGISLWKLSSDLQPAVIR